MVQLRTEFQRNERSEHATTATPAGEFFRWECQGHADFVAIQINMLKRLAAKRRLVFEESDGD